MYMFPDVEEMNTTHFFRFEKEIIRSGQWAELPTASKAIFPVIGVHANAEGKAWPSQETIGRMAGITPKTVRVGIEGMSDFQKIRFSTRINSRGRKKYQYTVSLPTIGKGKDFRFNRSLVESGFWASMTPGEQAVYPVLRAYAYFEPEEYFARCDELDIPIPEGVDYGNFIEEGYYEKRVFEIATPEVSVIAESAGVHTVTAKKAINELKKKSMVHEYSRYCNDGYYEDDDEKGYLVFIRPACWNTNEDKRVTYSYLNELNENITHE